MSEKKTELNEIEKSKIEAKSRNRVFLKAKEEREILQGFPWVYDNEIDYIKTEKEKFSLEECSLQDGLVVDVFSKGGVFLGSGVFNKKSKIVIRFLSREKYTEYDKKFFVNRVQAALDLRENLFKKTDSFRLIFAEADFLPGLIVEKYVDTQEKVILVVQFLALATEIFRAEIISALKTVIKPDGIFEKSDASSREKEGLSLKKEWIYKEFPTIITIKENGVLLDVDIMNGQKTGYFLDQKFNRKRVASFCRDKKVLDTFSHTGAFGLNAVLGGAKKVVSVDISEYACQTIQKNIAKNHAEKVMSCVCADVFDFLRECEERGEKFDVIVLDPPAFAKGADAINKAYGGYKEINMHAMNLLNKGGLLVSCSCSHFMEDAMFLDMIMHASRDTKKSVQILEKRGAASDHPILLGYPQSSYLKCVIAKVN